MAELSMERFTDTVINAMGPKTSPRVREVMTSLTRHMHDFAREVNLTTPEYLAACDFVVRIGQMSDERRNEAILASDIFGLESLVDFLDQHAAAGATPASTAEASDMTSSAILGPFWRENAPIYPNGASIIQGGIEGGEMALVQGRVYGGNGQPIEGAIVNVWETASPPIIFPDGPERWRSDEALKAEADPPQTTLEQRHQATGDILALRRRGFFSTGVLFSMASHIPVETAQ